MNRKILFIGLAFLVAAGLVWTGRAVYRAKRNIVSIDVYNVPLSDVVKQLERQTRETILARKDLETKVTLTVKNVPLDEALDKIGQQAGINWSKWHAIHDSDRALNQLEAALRSHTKIEEAGWTNLVPQDFPGAGPSWTAGDPASVAGGEVVVTKRKPVMIRLDSKDIKDGNVEAAVREQLKAAGADEATIVQAGAALRESSVDVDVRATGGGSNVVVRAGGEQPRIRMITRTRDGSGQMIEETWSPEHLVLEQRLQSRLGGQTYSDANETAARKVAKTVKGDLTTLYVLSRAPGGFPFAGKMMRQIHRESDGASKAVSGEPPPLPDIESAVRRAEAENYTRLTPEQRVLRAREKQASKASP